MNKKKIPQRIERLLEVFKLSNGKVGDLEKGEWKVVLDPLKMLKLEEELIEKNKDKNKEQFKCGVLGEDRFYIYTRFFYERPIGESKKTEVVLHNKVFWSGQIKGGSGVAVLVVSDDNKIVLNKSWRPTVENWILETPGTIRQSGESDEEVLKRCIEDDIGLEIERKEIITKEFFPDRGIMAGFVPLYLVKLKKDAINSKDLSLNKHLFFSKEELEDVIKKGFCVIDNKKYFCCDGYLLSILYLAEKRKLI